LTVSILVLLAPAILFTYFICVKKLATQSYKLPYHHVTEWTNHRRLPRSAGTRLQLRLPRL